MSDPSLRRRRFAALFVQVAIGEAAALGFCLPLTRTIGVIEPAPDDWTSSVIGVVLAIGCVVLGLSAALTTMRRESLRENGVVAGLAIGTGFLVAGLGVFLHEIWIFILGYGILVSAGLGIGVTTSLTVLIRSLAGRRRLALGLAVIAVGAGALLAEALAGASLDRFTSLASAGVWETFLALGTIIGVALAVGALWF